MIIETGKRYNIKTKKLNFINYLIINIEKVLYKYILSMIVLT